MSFIEFCGTVLGSWVFLIQSRLLVLAVGLKGGMTAARANYEIDNDRSRMIDEDLAIEFMKRAVDTEMRALSASYGIRFYMFIQWAGLLAGHSVAILTRCGWTRTRIEAKLDRIVDSRQELMRQHQKQLRG